MAAPAQTRTPPGTRPPPLEPGQTTMIGTLTLLATVALGGQVLDMDPWGVLILAAVIVSAVGLYGAHPPKETPTP